MGDLKQNSYYTDTIEYYNNNAADFIKSTVSTDLFNIQNEFLSRLKPGDYILDFGCGSGRDTKYFLEKGMQVDAADGSEQICRIASEYTGIKVRQMFFQELDEADRYVGIWACASLLHLSSAELEDVFLKMEKALHVNGILYASFKYGQFEGMRNGRYFTDMDEEKFVALAEKTDSMKTEKMWISADARPGRENEKWLNVLVRKSR